MTDYVTTCSCQAGQLCGICDAPSEPQFTLRKRTEMSRAFDRGNYANAYESTDLAAFKVDAMPEHMRAAFVLGFFGSYTLDEIGADDREAFDEAYHSPAGRYVVEVAKYTDSRAEEYAAEMAGES